MGKRYYCDYCDRSFADSGVNRKNHFKGSVHQRMKKQHYDSFRDAATMLAEESTKLPCKRFMSGTGCDFGTNCRFSHMTPETLANLQQQVVREKAKKESRQIQDDHEPTLDEWLNKRKKKQNTENQESETVKQVHYEVPPFLMSIPNLPPSLLPPTAEELQIGSQSEWG